MTRPDRDPYDVLGVSRQASAREISRAYRRAARATHPDSQPDDPSAAERFRDLTAAYEILGDPERRAAYDRANRTVRIVVRRRAPYDPPPVRLGRRRPSTSQSDFGFGFTRFGSGRSPTRGEDELFELAADMLRRLRRGWL